MAMVTVMGVATLLSACSEGGNSAPPTSAPPTSSGGTVISTWTPTGALPSARKSHTATLLPTGKVLVVGGTSINGISPSSYLASAKLYDPATGTWSPTGSLTTPRTFHTATLLPTGKVLVVGGDNFNDGILASAELYDPATGIWSPTGPLTTARASQTATLLPTGKVLVVGGVNDNGDHLASAELYDPAANGGLGTWSSPDSLTTARMYHTATLLPTGKVLVVGGTSDSFSTLASAELYDPATGTWSPTGSLTTVRGFHTATLLDTGKVLVVGGDTGTGSGVLASAELYDPATRTWSATGSLRTARLQQTATLLDTGTVLVVGGFGNVGVLASAELLTFN